jgi:site-specific recombinase XerC
MREMQRFGESKHQAKSEYRNACEVAGVRWNPATANGIFSFKTYDAYRQTAVEFSEWLKSNHSDIRDINAITRENIKEYLQQRQENGKSSWTVSKDMSALNKVLVLLT